MDKIEKQLSKPSRADRAASFTIVPSSPQALAGGNDARRRGLYPWRALGVGQSFAVPKDFIKLVTLQSLAYRTGKRLGVRFRVVDHGDAGYEVARLSEVDANEITFFNNENGIEK